MNKQTAVEFLIEKIDFDANVRCFSKDEWKQIFEQAIQMEKEQIKGAWYDGISGGQCGDSEQYYNETYGENKNKSNV
jgi:hypothetical protein